MNSHNCNEVRFENVFLTLTCFITLVCSAAARSIGPNLQDTVTIQDIVEFRTFSDVATCARSKLIAARVDQPSVSENRIDHDWRIIEWPSGNVRFTVDAGQSLNMFGYLERSHPQWSSDCRWLYYRALDDSEVQVWRFNGVTGAREKVTDDEADILDFALIHDGQALVYKTSASRTAIRTAEAYEYQHGVLIDENLWPWARLIRTMPVFGRWASYRRWGTYSAGHLLSQEPPTYKTITIRDYKVSIATESEIAELTKTAPDWAPQPNSGFIISPAGERAALVLKKKETLYGSPLLSGLAIVRHKSSSEILHCGDDRCTAERIVILKWSEDETSVYFIAEQQRGAAGVYEWTPESGKVQTVLETNGLLGALESGDRRYNSGSCPLIEDIAFCTAADPENPPRLMAISLSSGTAINALDPNSDLRQRFTLKAERIFWKDDLGRDAVGVLVYPREFQNSARYPLIITTYRCPGFLSGGIADGGPEYVLAEHGFFVLCIDKNYDVGEKLIAKNSYAVARYTAALAEYRTAIDLLVRKGLADRQRVGVTGLSASSQAVSYALTHSNIFHVAALRSVGVLEPAYEMFLRPNMTLTEAGYKDHGLVGSEQDKKAVYENLSVTVRAKRITIPILVQASDSEYLYSLPAFAALQKLGKPIEMIVFPDETHQLHQPMHQEVNFERNLDWFRFWLQGYEDPDPEKEEQYKRWRKMRDERCAWDEPEDEKPTYCEYAVPTPNGAPNTPANVN